MADPVAHPDKGGAGRIDRSLLARIAPEVIFQSAPVEFGHRPARRGVVDQDPVPLLLVLPVRCLERETQTLLDDRARYRTGEVESPAHGASRRQDLIDGEWQYGRARIGDRRHVAPSDRDFPRFTSPPPRN